MNNKNKILILAAVVLTVIICAECRMLFNDKETIAVTKNNDKSKSLDDNIVKVEDNSTQKQIVVNKTEKKPTNDRTKIWNGVKSRYEIKAQLDGTVWESTEVDPFTSRWLKFSIQGNTVTQYYAERTDNYDDPKNWQKLFTWDIYKVLETEKGFYSIALKEKEGHFSYTFLFFREKTVGYGWGEEGASTVLLKLI